MYQRVDEVRFINVKVGKFTVGDIKLAMKLDEEEVSTPPEKNSLYEVTVSCDNALGRWNMEEWGADIRNIRTNEVECEVSFKTPKPTISEITEAGKKTSIELNYKAEGINVGTICKYGIEEGKYSNEVEATNTNCIITELEMDTLYYYEVCAKNSGGEACQRGNIKTKGKDLADNVELGDYIKIIPTSTSYTISSSLTGYTSNQTINPSELNLWRVIKKNEDGTVDVVSEYVSSTKIYFRGNSGFVNYIGSLNTIAAQYTNDKYVLKTRYIGYKNQTLNCSSRYSCSSDGPSNEDVNLVTSVLGDITAKDVGGTIRTYWVASRVVVDENSIRHYATLLSDTRDNNGVEYYWLVINNDGDTSRDTYMYPFSLRPVLTLKSDVEITRGDGKNASAAYQFS